MQSFHLSLNLQDDVSPSEPEGELWYLKSWLELGKTTSGGDKSNFCALQVFSDSQGKTGGTANWLEVPYAAVRDVIQRVNHTTYGQVGWHYLVRETDGSIYVTIDGANEDMPGVPIRWWFVILGSKEDGLRNMVKVIEGDPLRDRFVRIAGIPKCSDYTIYSPETHPHLFHRVYCAYNNGSVIGDTPKYPTAGILWMGLFEPSSGFKHSLGSNELWIPSEFLHSRVGDVPAPSTAIVHELLTIDSVRPLVAHLYKIDLTRVAPFITPRLGYKLTPSQFRDKYNMDFVINGDGGPWVTGQLASAGRWMSRGNWESTATGEFSIWFDGNGNCKMSYAKPIGMSPWNVISGPKLMIRNGDLTGVFSSLVPASRSAFGLFDNAHAVAIAVEGNEDNGVGATEQDLADIGMSIGLRDMMELDSGSSTGAIQKNGVSYSAADRQVLNALCFKEKI